MKEHAARFWSKVSKTNTCWLWTGSRDRHPRGKGLTYGTFGVGSRTDKSCRHIKAHRVSWDLAYGAIPQGVMVLHRCDVPHCVRPDHLFLGKQADNMADMMKKGRGVQHTGVDHGNAKFTKQQVDNIRKRYRKGAKKGSGAAGVIAAEFGVDRHTIQRIAIGKTYP